MAVVGYARVSTRDQHPEAQTDALAAAGCDKTFTEHASGTLARRPALDEALSYLRAGDTLVVTKLDRLGRSVGNLKQIADDLQARQVGLRAVSQGIDTTTPGGRLFFHMLAAIAERETIRDRTVAGLTAARARGRVGGRPFKLSAEQRRQARKMYDDRELTVKQIGAVLGVSRTSIYRALGHTAAPAPPATPAPSGAVEPAAVKADTAEAPVAVSSAPVPSAGACCTRLRPSALAVRHRPRRPAGPDDSLAQQQL